MNQNFKMSLEKRMASHFIVCEIGTNKLGSIILVLKIGQSRTILINSNTNQKRKENTIILKIHKQNNGIIKMASKTEAIRLILLGLKLTQIPHNLNQFKYKPKREKKTQLY